MSIGAKIGFISPRCSVSSSAMCQMIERSSNFVSHGSQFPRIPRRTAAPFASPRKLGRSKSKGSPAMSSTVRE